MTPEAPDYGYKLISTQSSIIVKVIIDSIHQKKVITDSKIMNLFL